MPDLYVSNTLLDNSNNMFQVVNAIKNCLRSESLNEFKIATAYWDLPALVLIYDELAAFLEKENTKLKIMVGTEPIARRYQIKVPVLSSEEYIKRHILDLDVTEQYVKVVQLLLKFCNETEDSKIKIKLLNKDKNDKPVFLHAKTYIFLGTGVAKAIVGSSNFTKKGLTENSELNYLETNQMIVTATPNEYSISKGHNYWFDERWNLADDWNRYFLEEVLRPSDIWKKVKEINEIEEHKELSPYELYIKLLQEKFGDLVNTDKQNLIESYLPSKYKPLSYQLDAVSQCYSIMKEHGGFFLSDVVGLGKTIVGTMLIKHFLNMSDDREKNVLIITPPAIRSSWIKTIKDFDDQASSRISNNINIISLGSISNLVHGDAEDYDLDIGDEYIDESSLVDKNYGLILIDESHRFRNSNTTMYKALDTLISDIGTNTGVYPYIGLLSATPQNNRPRDLMNQIYLFERNKRDSTLKKAEGGNIEKFFSIINEKYNSIISSKDIETANEIVNEKKIQDISLQIRDCILRDILVRRTRTDVIKYYQNDLVNQNIKFPSISGPHELEYKLSSELAELFSKTMEFICPRENFNFDEPNSICYYRYRSFAYLIDAKEKAKYSANNRSAQDVALQLAKIMQINLVKRLESSFQAFKQSLKNLKQYTKNMIDMWEHDAIFICPDIDINAEFVPKNQDNNLPVFIPFELIAENIRKKIKLLNNNDQKLKEKNKEYSSKDFDPSYIEKLREDYRIIDWLYQQWSSYDLDPKLEKFKKSLRELLLGKDKQNKIVIFTEAIDTVKSLERAIQSEFPNINVLYVTSKNRDEKEQTIRENFDANYELPWKNDYQIIITTEVLSEGINLHRANTVLNYDTPWNATRLMQRIGRVNRIGSSSDTIYVYNFMPSSEGDEQINLVKKAFVKLQSFHTVFGEDNKIFSNKESVFHYDLEKHINGEESPIEKYLYELKEYKKNNENRYKYIESIKESIEMSVSDSFSNSLFMIKVKDSSSMYVKCDSKLNVELLSASDMFSSFKACIENNKKDVFPDNWQKQKDAAQNKVMETLSWHKNMTKRSKRITLAKGFLKEYGEGKKFTISEATKQMLALLFKELHQKGNIDYAKKVIDFFSSLQRDIGMIELSDNEFDEMVKKEFSEITSRIKQNKEKDAFVFIGLAK